MCPGTGDLTLQRLVEVEWRVSVATIQEAGEARPPEDRAGQAPQTGLRAEKYLPWAAPPRWVVNQESSEEPAATVLEAPQLAAFPASAVAVTADWPR